MSVFRKKILILCGISVLAMGSGSLSAAESKKAASPTTTTDDFLPTFGAKLKEIKDAIEGYNKRLKQTPKDASLYFLRSQAYAAIGQHNKARLDRRKALELNPELKPDVDQYEAVTREVCNTEIVIGHEFLRRGKFEFAEIKFRSAMEADATNPGGYLGMGLLCNAQKKFDQAISFFSKAIEVKPDSEAGYYQRGNAYCKTRQHAKAVADLTKAIEISGRAEAYYLRSFAYKGMKDTLMAEQDLKKANELDTQIASKVLSP